MEWLANFVRSIPDSPQGLLDFITNLLLEHGYVVVLLGAALDNFGLPSSGDVVVFAGGWLANGGRAVLPLIMLAGLVGALISDNSVYWIGRFGGRPLINRVLKIRLLHFLVDEESLGKAERYFAEHGGKTAFLGRFAFGLRSMIPLFAGVTRMRYRRFLPYNLSGAATWAVAYATVGYVFGEYWNELLSLARSVGYGFVVLVVLVVGFYLLRRRRAGKGT